MFTITNSPTDGTTQLFDTFDSVQMVVNASEYDVVLSFFKENTDKQQIAENFTALLFKVAQENSLSVLSMLENLKGANSRIEINQVMAFYLNSFRSRTAMYGTGYVLRPNEPAQRNIVL